MVKTEGQCEKLTKGGEKMNRSNTGANRDTGRMIEDILLLSAAYAAAAFFTGTGSDLRRLWGMTGLAAVFILIYVMGNGEQYLYNVTLFGYVDRIQRRRTRSFLTAAAATAVLLPFITEDGTGYFLFLILAYSLESLKILWGARKSQGREQNRGGRPRTAFVGKRAQYNKFRYFLKKTSIRMEFVGYITMSGEELRKIPEEDRGEYLGSLEDLEELIRQYHLDQIYILQKREEQLSVIQRYVDLCIDMGVTVRMVVDIYKRRRADSYVSCVGTYPVITYHTVTLNTGEQIVKRAMDIVGGIVGILIFSPVMLATAIAIKLDSPGPVIFRQTRVGKNGRTFRIYKFRSMYTDAEERKAELLSQNEIAGGVMFKMKDDPRITPVGKIIRKLSIDELPQFFNVVAGSMSLVGTRPPTLDEVEKYERRQWRRISIKPGLTGMWQVGGRSLVTDFEKIVEMDVEYIDNWSLMEDIRILCKTVTVLLKHADAY